MSIESELQKAKATGVTITKEKLAAVIKASNQQRFPILHGKQSDFVVMVLPKSF